MKHPVLRLVAVTALALVCAVPARAEESGCDYTEPFTPFDVVGGDNPVVMANSRVVELRASNRTRCAWGRLSEGKPGEEIWTDRKNLDGSDYQGFLGHTRIESGNGAHTEAFGNDRRLMRACASAERRIECTGWF
ncbi:glycosyl hydrolase [Saccharothrix deserti]|uniref:glycosyl hydrolase n=1 Tax=Saccharothrix deserti TaxID=2593674 RepID=UPI00131E9D92|nr:glycosyl hydrolase [Saccharothrix deserti]